MSFYF